MKLLLLLCALSARYTFQNIIPINKIKDKCEGFDVRGLFHKEEVLAKGLNRPYQLSYYHHKHELYFSNNIGDDNKDEFEIQLLLKNGSVYSYDVVKNGFATAIDQENGIAYFGGSDGVYMDNLKEESKPKIIIEKHNIWDMFFKKNLYFITYPSQKLYKYEHEAGKKSEHGKKSNKHAKIMEPEHQKWIHEKIYQFAIDGDDDIFITNKTGLYMIKKGSEERHLIQGETVFRAIEINNNGDAHFCGRHGIYVPHKHNHTLHQIAHVKNIFGLAFNNDGHMIYSNPHQIVKLVPSLCNTETPFGYVPLPINA